MINAFAKSRDEKTPIILSHCKKVTRCPFPTPAKAQLRGRPLLCDNWRDLCQLAHSVRQSPSAAAGLNCKLTLRSNLPQGRATKPHQLNPLHTGKLHVLHSTYQHRRYCGAAMSAEAGSMITAGCSMITRPSRMITRPVCMSGWSRTMSASADTMIIRETSLAIPQRRSGFKLQTHTSFKPLAKSGSGTAQCSHFNKRPGWILTNPTGSAGNIFKADYTI